MTTTLYAIAGGSIALIAIYPAAIHMGRGLVDFHDRHTQRPGIAPIQGRRQPVAAITARPHFEAVDELGPWNPSRHPQVDAHLFDALTDIIWTRRGQR